MAHKLEKEMETITIDEFKSVLKGQLVPSHEHVAFKCPICGTIQSAQDLIDAGAGKNFNEVEKYLAFSCVGRWTDAGDFHKKIGRKMPTDATGRSADYLNFTIWKSLLMMASIIRGSNLRHQKKHRRLWLRERIKGALNDADRTYLSHDMPSRV